MFLLDTNVVSELRRPERANAGVVAWAAATPATQMFISVISLLEIRLGILQVTRRDPAAGAVLRRWLDHHVVPAFAGRVLAIDAEVALRCAELHVPDPRPDRDALIAATALVHRLTVVTRNLADFAPIGGAVLNPWG